MGEALRVAERTATQSIQRQNKRRTGALLGGFVQVKESPEKARLINTAPHAGYVDLGTVTHDIVARRKPLLVFYWEKLGVWFRGKKVRHPGTKPRLFAFEAAMSGESVLRTTLERGVEAAARKFSS